MKIAVLQSDYVNENIRHLFGDIPDIFAKFFARQSNISIDVFNCVEGHFPSFDYICDAYIITGSRYSAYDNSIPWIMSMKAFIRDCQYHQSKLIGICFGHQIIADTLGGKVVKSMNGWNLGIQELEVLKTMSWMRPNRKRLHLIFNHRDQLIRLPDGAHLLAGTDACPIQMYEIGGQILCIQAHPEYSVTYQEALMSAARSNIDPRKYAEALISNQRYTTDGDVILDWIVSFINTDKNHYRESYEENSIDYF
jgi:GMP synthase-like glutamine amidotransferase